MQDRDTRKWNPHTSDADLEQMDTAEKRIYVLAGIINKTYMKKAQEHLSNRMKIPNSPSNDTSKAASFALSEMRLISDLEGTWRQETKEAVADFVGQENLRRALPGEIKDDRTSYQTLTSKQSSFLRLVSQTMNKFSQQVGVVLEEAENCLNATGSGAEENRGSLKELTDSMLALSIQVKGIHDDWLLDTCTGWE